LESLVPSSTVSSRNSSGMVHASTQKKARELRTVLELLDDLPKSRARTVESARRRAQSDDVRPRITREAANFERWVEVKPAMFENIIEEELAKYERYKEAVEETEEEQENLLAQIKDLNDAFLQSRRDDPSVQLREAALQSLDLAYHRYKEIMANLTEGIKFYNDFANILTQLRDSCKEWVYKRREDVSWLTSSLNDVSIAHEDEDASSQDPFTATSQVQGRQVPESSSPPPKVQRYVSEVSTTPSKARGSPRLKSKAPAFLPAPDSEEWETFELPPSPRVSVPASTKKSKKASALDPDATPSRTRTRRQQAA